MTPHGFVFELSGGHPALDFADTLDERGKEQPRELLGTYADLLNWARQAGVIEPQRQKVLARAARKSKQKSESALAAARRAREVIFSVFAAVAEGREVPEGALRELRNLVDSARRRKTLRFDGTGVSWAWTEREGDLGQVVRRVIDSAVDLLTGESISRVKICDGPGCRWLFLDASRNGKRRWCDMTICGNRTKVRRHYRKSRGEL
jgi:predicted RNA-binding Zn ribbon-like protein